MLWGGLAALIAILVAYNMATEPSRVRARVEAELSGALGVQVTVEHASFSLMRGLLVEGVKVYADGGKSEESTLLTAGQISASVDYSRLLLLKVELKQLVAGEVRLTLVENQDDGTWNFDRLIGKSRSRAGAAGSRRATGRAPSLPELQLNDAVVRYFRQSAQRLELAAEVRIDATATPMPGRRIGFTVVTAPGADLKRVRVLGMLDRDTGEVSGQISEVNISPAIRSMLPENVGNWFREFDFAGRFSIPGFKYRFATAVSPESFEISLTFSDTQANVRPEHWLTGRERWNMGLLRQSLRTLEMVGMNRPLERGEAIDDAPETVCPRDLVAQLAMATRTVPLSLKDLNGTIDFTQSQVNLRGVRCLLQDQALQLTGRLDGYSGEAPLDLAIGSAPDSYLRVPPSRRFMTWLPDDVRKAYLQFKPRGKAKLDLHLARSARGAAIVPDVRVNVFDAVIEFEDFPYPLERCTGVFAFGRDPASGEELLRIENLRGYGIKDGPNAKSPVTINGAIGPFVRGGPGVNITVVGQEIYSEPIVRRSFPPEVARALLLFGPPDYGRRVAENRGKPIALSEEESLAWPHFYGNFTAKIHREAGYRKSVDTDIQLNLLSISGCYKAFAYPMEDASCVLHIHDDRLDINNLRLLRNGANLTLNGVIPFDDMKGGYFNPVVVNADAKNVLVDEDLLNALPEKERSWLKVSGLAGRVDIEGKVFTKREGEVKEPEVDFDLMVRLHEASLLKDARGAAFTGLNGVARLQPERLGFSHVSGRRGEGTLDLTGDIQWPPGKLDVRLDVGARNLLLDSALRDLLPEEGQKAWDQQQPEGTTDLELKLVHHRSTDDVPADSGAGPGPTTAPSASVYLALRPVKLSATPSVFPVRLDDIKGQIIFDGQKLVLDDVTARRGDSTFGINAEGTIQPLDLRIKARAAGLAPDAKLLAAMPEAVSDVVRGMKADGRFTVRLDKLNVRQSSKERRVPARAEARQANAATTRPITAPLDVDYGCTVVASDASFDPGVPITHVSGAMDLSGEIRADELTQMDGRINVSSYEILGRKGSDLTAAIRRPAYSQDILVQSLKSRFAGGNISGDVTLVSHEQGPVQYSAMMVVQNAGLAEVFGDALKNPAGGRFSASFDVEGLTNDPSSRRGKGNIEIEGKDMVEAPIVLGFFRMVNLSLPVRDGVNRVAVAYTLQREKAVLDSIELSSPGLRIYGDGILDFSRNEVNLTLNTENPGRLPIPLLNQLGRWVREGLMQIRVKGKLDQPQVQAVPLPTFSATLGEVVQDIQQGRGK